MCTMCGGKLILLGQLGPLVWLRCRNCGMDQSLHITDDEVVELACSDDYDEDLEVGCAT